MIQLSHLLLIALRICFLFSETINCVLVWLTRQSCTILPLHPIHEVREEIQRSKKRKKERKRERERERERERNQVESGTHLTGSCRQSRALRVSCVADLWFSLLCVNPPPRDLLASIYTVLRSLLSAGAVHHFLVLLVSMWTFARCWSCLLYTSDAADE